MTNTRRIRLRATSLLAAGLLAGAAVIGATSAEATNKVTICHAAGQAGTTHYITLTIGYPAVYGPAGHFYENGTPRAGHEQDYLGPCTVSTTTTEGPEETTTTTEGEQETTTTTVGEKETTTTTVVDETTTTVPDEPEPELIPPLDVARKAVPAEGTPTFTG